jgi:hypothetical protein
MLVSLLPPGIGGKGDVVVVDRLVRAFDIVARVRINAGVGTADNAVVTTVGVIISLIPWQRQGRQSIGSFHSFSATVVASATMVADNVAENVVVIFGTVALLKKKTTLNVDGVSNAIAVPVTAGIIDRLCLRTTILWCYS